MSATVQPKLDGFRWSLTRTCPRMAVYAERGFEQDEPSEKTRRLWKMGHLVEDLVVDEIAAEFGEENVERQRIVYWPAGEAHVDAFVIPRARPVEVKHHRDGSFSEEDLVQLAGHLHWDPEAGPTGVLVVVDRDLEKYEVTFELTADWSSRVEELAAQVVHARDAGGLPDRVCGRPSDGFGRFCPFIDECFGDWEPPPRASIRGQATEYARELLMIDETTRSIKERSDEHVARRDEIRGELLRLIEPDREFECGDGIVVKATPIQRTSYRVADAIKAGAVSEEVMAPFVRIGEEYHRWTLKVVEGSEAFVAPAEDYGDVPF